MKQALIIGNGRSRLKYNLHDLGVMFTTYGCNALYRDYIPNYLISMDSFMVDEILQNKVHYKCNFFTQHINKYDKLANEGEPINFVQTYTATPDSGTAAIELASTHGYDTIYMIGFDYNHGGINNVYAGTNNYHNKSYSTPIIQDDKWRNRLYNIVKRYTKIQYYRITDEEYVGSLTNYNHILIDNFEVTRC